MGSKGADAAADLSSFGNAAGRMMAEALAAGEELNALGAAARLGPGIAAAGTEGVTTLDDNSSVVRRRAVIDHLRVAQRTERIMGAQSPVFFASRASHGDPTRAPIFLVGLATPAAKRVRAILSAHSRIHAARPLNLIPVLLSCLEDWDRAAGRDRVFPESLDGISADDSLKVAHWLLERLQREDPGAEHILDGFGLDAALVGLVHLIFPKAPMILCLDDGDDRPDLHAPPQAATQTAASEAEDLPSGAPTPPADADADLVEGGEAEDSARGGDAAFGLPQGPGAETWFLRAAQARMILHWRNVLPGRVYEIRRADLMADPEGTTRALFDHLGLPLEARVIQAITAPVDRMPRRGGESGIGAAVAHIRGGRLDQAEAVLQAILAKTPENPAALHLLGVVHHRKGDPDRAAPLLRRSLILVGKPMPDWEHNLAVVERAREMRAANPQGPAPIAPEGGDPV